MDKPTIKFLTQNGDRPLNILLIGPLPPPIGGATCSFDDLVTALRKRPDVNVAVIDLSHDQNSAGYKLKVAVETLWQTLCLGRGVDVVTFHANQNGRVVLGPIIYVISRLLRKPLIVRAFGGTFDLQYEALPALIRWIMRKTYFNADVSLFQTKRMVSYFDAVPIRRAEWFSNYALDAGLTEQMPYKPVARKFVYLGRITPTKGIEEILNAVPLLHDGITIDLFGPLQAPYANEQINARGKGTVRYCGVLNKEEIVTQLWGYDVLILPTYWSGEGYPGVVLEAYMHGLPVVATRWQSIPEIVDAECGILIEPRNTVALATAVNQLYADNILYQRLQHGARKKAKLFPAHFWQNRFVELCYEVAKPV